MHSKDTLILPDLFSAKRVLCVQPHYDDNDIYTGGTIACLHDVGAEIIYLTVTDDLVGFLDQTTEDTHKKHILREEQKKAGEIIGVDQFLWLDYPDAGTYDISCLRQDIIRYLLLLQPDFLITVDPWLPYEAHQDHIKTGHAVAEAAILARFPRLTSGVNAEAGYDPLSLQGVVFYNTAWPNLTVDIHSTVERKHRALSQYHAEYTADEIISLIEDTEMKERTASSGEIFSHAECLKIVRPSQLHGNPQTWRS